MLLMLQSLPELLSTFTKIDLEIFRGDSFQIRVWNPIDSLKVALAIRAHIRSFKVAEHNRQWDARMAIGVGTVEFEMALLQRVTARRTVPPAGGLIPLVSIGLQ